MARLPTDRAALEELVANLEEQAEYRKWHRLEFYQPYPKQAAWHEMGASKQERALFAGNQEGKTYAGAAEVAMHATGLYPDWWTGWRCTVPPRIWVCGEEGQLLRDGPQQQLFGPAGVEELRGSGFIPKDLLVGEPSYVGRPADLYDTIHVRHKSGGVCAITQKTYGQRRARHQTEAVHVIWDDEEPPYDIYMEHQARITNTNGRIICTFTPLLGRTQVVMLFLDQSGPNRSYIRMGLADAKHITPEGVAAALARYPLWMRASRLEGMPMQGEGAVFEIPWENIVCADIPIGEVPLEWRKLWGVDFGIDHPFAAVLGAWDKDSDTIYVVWEVWMRGATKLAHIPALRAIAPNVPVAWPHDGGQRDKGSGLQLAQQYRTPGPGMPGLSMRAENAAFPNGSISLMAGVDEMRTRFETGRLKVCKRCVHFAEEFAGYHVKDGLIVRENDDVLSACRMLLMDRRYAVAVPLGSEGLRFARQRERASESPIVDPWTGRPVRSSNEKVWSTGGNPWRRS